MADTKIKGQITSFKLGRFEFEVAPGTSVADLLREQKIEFQNGTTLVDGIPVPVRQLENTPVPQNGHVHLAKSSAGGTAVTA